MSAPTVQISLDNGTGTFPYDVTTYVRQTEGYSWTRGRTDEHQDNQPGSISLVFDNTDAAFTPGRVNLCPNPGFEIWTVPPNPDGWSKTGGGITWSQQTGQRVDGSFSLQSVGTVAGGQTYNFVTVSCLPSTQYTLSAWRFVPVAPTAAAAGNSSLWLQDDTGVIVSTSTLSVAVATGVWVRESVTLVTGAAATVLTVRLFIPQGTVYWDAVELVQGAGPTVATFNDQSVRITVNSTVRFTGRIQSWPTKWPSGDDTFAVSATNAMDPLAKLSRKTLRSAVVEEIAVDSPAALWTLGEIQFATQGNDSTGQGPALVATSAAPSTSTPPAWGAELNDPAGSTGVTFVSDPTVVAPIYLACSYPKTLTSLHLEVAFISNLANTASVFLASVLGPLSRGSLALVGAGGGLVQVRAQPGDNTPVTVAAATNSALHIVALEVDSTSVHVILDGVVVYTAAGVAGTFDLSAITVGEALSGTTNTLQVAYVNVGTRLTDARVISHQRALLFDLIGETPAARIARLLSYTTVSAGSLDTTGDTLLGPTQQGGKSVLDCVNDTAAADLGNAFADRSGALSYVAGTTIAGRATPVGPFDANWLGEDTEVLQDMYGVVNVATGQRTSGGNVFGPYFDAASRLLHDDYPQSYTWNVLFDAQVVDRTRWIVANYANPQPRVAQLVLDLLTMDPTTLAAALTLDLTSLLRITGMPAQTPGGTQLDVLVESITETVSAGGGNDVWTLTLNVSMKALRGGWVLGDSTYGVLGVTTKLYV